MSQAKFTNSARYKCLEYLKKQSMDLYLSYCGIEVCDPSHAYGPTERTEFLLHYILSGKGVYTVNGNTYHLGKHQAFLIYPNMTTFYQADSDDPWTYIWIGFNGIKAENCLNYADFRRDKLINDFHNEKALLDSVDGILSNTQLTYASDLLRESYLLQFLATLIQEKHQAQNSEVTYDYPIQVYVEHAMEFIEHNYASNIKVNDIANYVCINRSHLTRIFKAVLSVSPQQYIINYRLDKACTLLKTTAYPINTIAAMVGYEDPLTFSKVFKAFRNESPKAYRSNMDNVILAQRKGE
jgi:AraC-type DNA-binding domain-containing proteins